MRITVLMSPDEEVGALAERDLVPTLGAEHDVVLSFEGPGQDENIRLATSGTRCRRSVVRDPHRLSSDGIRGQCRCNRVRRIDFT